MSTRKFDTRAFALSGSFVAFVGVHLACFAALWTGVRAIDVAVCAFLYFLRMFAITGGYHRYFSHRAFRTGRVFQFVLGFLAQSSLQSGLIWWAAKHRDHHSHSDLPADAHSPVQYGFWFSHVGWIFNEQAQKADYARVPDLTRFPELVWLDRHQFLPGVLMGAAVWALLGWPGLIVGFFWSTVLTYHGTFAINSLAHVIGRQRYLTGDDSRNHLGLALVTMGEGWHNNHHYYMASARQGFRWWEIDLTYYALRAFAAIGIVWDLKNPPSHVLAGQRQLSDELKDRVAARLAATFSTDKLVENIRARWAQAHPGQAWDEWCRRAAEHLPHFTLPELPSVDEMKRRAQRMFACSPALDEIAARARQMLEQAVFAQLHAVPARV